LSWDKKKKRFVKGDGVGADNIKLVKTEGGTRLPATYRSGRFDEWKAKSRIALPKVGEAENDGHQRKRPIGIGGQRFRHNKVVAPKPLDKLGNDYERKVRQMKKKSEAESQQGEQSTSSRGRGGRYGGKSMGRVKTELKTSEQIRKTRKALDNRRAKNARPSRGGGGGGRGRGGGRKGKR
jgi:ATP-dependent RNA helicase DDX54/DBP10